MLDLSFDFAFDLEFESEPDFEPDFELDWEFDLIFVELERESVLNFEGKGEALIERRRLM